jgi:hypothetical protein
MNKTALTEAVGGAQTLLTAVLQTLNGQTGIAGAQFSQSVAALMGNAAAEIAALSNGNTQFFTDFGACFDQARLAGGTFVGMDAVRTAALGLSPVGPPAIAIKNFAIRMALAEEGQILAATTFTSRQQIDDYFAQINASFDAAIVVAADNGDNVSYQALITLYAAVSNDLGTRALSLPTLVQYSFATRMPSLWLAQRLYQDPTRAKQLVLENMPIHPLFMPAAGIALSQ